MERYDIRLSHFNGTREEMDMRLKIVTYLVALVIAIAIVSILFTFRQPARAEPDIFASPIHGGCYIAAPNECRFHIEPFTIFLNTTTGTKLVLFQIVAIPSVGSSQVIYDWRPDVSNPAPAAGSTYAPSMVALDYAATCGKSYRLNLIGRDTLDGGTNFSLGLTNQFTCPSTVP
jgi:hypothetical protein